MRSRKLIVTHGKLLAEKYGSEAVAEIDEAVRHLASADELRGIETHYVRLDAAEEMKRYGSKAVSRQPSASSCKKVIDKLFSSLSPDYLVLLGSDDVIPHFVVPNPSFAAVGDTETEIPTDNPYASSVPFDVRSRATYLVPDRVIGRIPDVPGSSDTSWLLSYLRTAASSRPLRAGDFGLDLLLCCDTWRDSGIACVSALSRRLEDLLVSPPSVETSTTVLDRHAARFQMIKCHGNRFDPQFYGEKKLSENEPKDFPPVMRSTALEGRTTPGTVVGAMCCYGASVYDPNHPAALVPGAPAIANVYLKQSAFGFAGSTSIAWVGPHQMACADLIVCHFLTRVLAGASLGTALLDAKQRFLGDINKDGRMPDAQEEKTLLQFVLLGDPSIQAVTSHEDTALEAGMPAAGDTYLIGQGESGREHRLLVKSTTTAAMASERRSRRAFHFDMGAQLRERIPKREVTDTAVATAEIFSTDELARLRNATAVVHRVTRAVRQPELTRLKKRARVAMTAAVTGLESAEPATSTTVREETLQYYWFAHTPHERVIDATVVKVETDVDGKLLRKRVLVTA